MAFRSPKICLLNFAFIFTFASPAFADSSDIAASAEAVAQQPALEGRRYSQPRPPGSVSEDGDMKVWDTRGPVDVSPHVPSTTVNTADNSVDQNQGVAPGVPAGVVVDARQHSGIYPGAEIPIPVPRN